MHSESIADQEQYVRLFLSRMPETDQENLFNSKVHREIIRQFGRFPFRNNALSRSSTKPELEYLSLGGYRHSVVLLNDS
jgi:uncharacterized protein (DUF924 family)